MANTPTISNRRPAAVRCRAAFGISIALLIVSVAGCGSSGPKLVPVHGKITLSGGPWPQKGVLYFTPTEPAPDYPKRPGRAEFDVDGNFAASTFVAGDGLYPGKYKILVECWDIPPSMDPKAPARRGFAAAKFDSPLTSGLEADVPVSGKAADLQLDATRRTGK